jgi:hypothetical protein
MMKRTQIWERRVTARSSRTLFARKVHSGNEPLMQLLQRILHELDVYLMPIFISKFIAAMLEEFKDTWVVRNYNTINVNTFLFI